MINLLYTPPTADMSGLFYAELQIYLYRNYAYTLNCKDYCIKYTASHNNIFVYGFHIMCPVNDTTLERKQ